MATLMSQSFGKGGQGKNRRCDATCHRARKPDCACICGGRYHGKGDGDAAQMIYDDFTAGTLPTGATAATKKLQTILKLPKVLPPPPNAAPAPDLHVEAAAERAAGDSS